MFVVCVTVWVKPDNVDQFLRATLENQKHTRREPGNLRFDVLRGQDEPGRFFLYEVYRSEDDFHKHHEAAHYLKWREQVADWMAQKRQGLKYEAISPTGEAAWRAD
jgi:autoinducer 2-degrading protein